MERIIKVTGKGKLSVKPDTTCLRIELKGEHAEYDETLRMSTEHTQKIKEIFEELGFNRESLKTYDFDIYKTSERYCDSSKGWITISGYKFRHIMKIEFPIDNKLLSKILYALAHSAISPDFSIDYTVADREKCKNELLEKAVADSKAKAEILAKSAGVRLGQIATIDYSWGEIDIVSRPMNIELDCCIEGATSADTSYDIDIDADDINISDTVTVIWSII